MRRLVLGCGLLLGVLGLSCGDSDGSETATPTTVPSVAPTPRGSLPAPSATPTPGTTRRTPTPPGPTSTPTAAADPDGTVDPLNPGDLQPKSVKALTGETTPLLVAVRASVHPESGGWERVVFEFDGPARPAADIRYVDTVTECGSGRSVEVPGAAGVLLVRFDGAAAHDESGSSTTGGVLALPAPDGARVFVGGRQVCDFEAEVSWALGARSERPFKVTTLADPTRVVIDVRQ